ncbi:hypothetical protein OIE63_22150 [Streptomyces sp. NBC_01795]|uniref:hypothetical protein n=1 Tax=Streptomyces sp. NBC_01795 TaxID=2975943 RepID=UPI002DD9657F|nr:hypothetical protein [Streptomyces sp. NBC_01795]WSA93981.1 hypothetical protein OIE63_22150 [Streptomyces sp. NBC_01795]
MRGTVVAEAWRRPVAVYERAAVGDLVGIESDQLVFDYLSRIGDLAHSTRMTAAERAKLVGGLRGEIDKARAAEGGAESKAAVRKILGRLGRPEDVVAAANGGTGTGSVSAAPSPSVPTQRGARGSGEGADADEAAPPPLPGRGTGPSAAFGASSPHLASLDELGPVGETDPDWWRVDPSPYGSGPGGGGGVAAGEPLPGFVGGIELPEVLKPPPTEEEAARAKKTPAAPVAPGTPAAEEAVPAPATAPAGTGALLRRALGGGRGPKAERVARTGGFVELTAAGLLVAGVVTGSFVPLALGWLAAWWSPKLSRIEAKWAAVGMPAVVAVGTGVWLWGRTDGRWGAPIAQGGDALREAMGDVFPILLRVAAGASALYLVWRARRPSGG